MNEVLSNMMDEAMENAVAEVAATNAEAVAERLPEWALSMRDESANMSFALDQTVVNVRDINDRVTALESALANTGKTVVKTIVIGGVVMIGVYVGGRLIEKYAIPKIKDALAKKPVTVAPAQAAPAPAAPQEDNVVEG